MSLPLTTDEGVVYVTTSGTPVYWNAGLGYDVTGALCITTTAGASDTYIGGKRRDAEGRLVVADATVGGRPWNYNAGWPSDKNTGATIRQINQTPTATDPRVAGIAIGPRGGVYMTTDPIPNPGVFSPADLFANGEIGFWYDPSDFSTMFQDNLGTIPVTAVGQPVGRILDKSGNLNHATQATSTARPTLRQDSANAYYLDFDGVDDYISTAAFNMGASGKVTMFAGTANAKTTGSGTLCEFSPNYMNNGGSFAMLTPSLATSHISFGSRGSLGAGEKETQQPPAGGLEKRVITAAQNFATTGDYGCDYIRIHQIPIGNLIGAGNSNVGAGPLGTFKMNIGAREGGTTNRLQGRIYSLICASNLYDNATLVSCEEWIDAKLNPGGAVWSPALLFANGEQGAWYDPSDLTTMFQDRAGTTPVTADGQTVGLILDKSGRGNHATAPSDAARPLYKTDGTYHWLQFDGVNNSLSTAAIDFTTTDKMGVFTGVLHTTEAMALFLELSESYNSNAGSFYTARASEGVGTSSLSFRGSKTKGPSDITVGINIKYVFRGTGDIANDISNAYKNGVLGSAPAGDLGTGTLGNYPLYIGARANTSLFFAGNIYSLIIRGALFTPQEITDTETWVNGKTGAY